MKKVMALASALLICLCIFVFGGCADSLVEKNEDIAEIDSWHFTSGVPNNAIKVKHSESRAIFELRVDKGAFWVTASQKYQKTAAMKNGEVVYWQSEQGDGEFDTAFAEITVKVDNNIVGYAVVKITRDGNSLNYGAEILKSATFPKVDNQYQKVTQEQVDERIQEVKN